eukprot:1139726-Pelagomonas_calceolata.AAC.8
MRADVLPPPVYQQQQQEASASAHVGVAGSTANSLTGRGTDQEFSHASVRQRIHRFIVMHSAAYHFNSSV